MQLKRLALASVMLPFAVSAATADDDAQALSTRIRDEVRTARALPDLYRVYELRDELSDLGPFARLLAQVAADESARADVRAAALELRAQVAIAQGQLPQARTIIDRAAPVRSSAILGPFENEGRPGLRAIYGPEQDGYRAAARYPGKEHEVIWRT